MSDTKIEPLYWTVALGTIISSLATVIQYHLKRSIRSRSQMTILTSIILTSVVVSAACGFNMIRIRFDNFYRLPDAVVDHSISSPSHMFRFHFFVDLIPALFILIQSILSMIINYSLLCKAKRKFSFGEAAIVSQLGSACFLTWLLVLYSDLTGAGPFRVDLPTKIILNIGACLFFIAFMPIYALNVRHKSNAACFTIPASLIAAYLATQHVISEYSQLDPLTWLASYLFEKHQRVSLFSLWISITTACISLSTSWARLVGETSSLIRKTFHVAICIVFMTGFNQDINFTRFSAGGVFCIMFILELCRAWQLKYIGPPLEKVCGSLRGRWDNKFVTLSHIYLLVGGFLPLWLLPTELSSTKNLALSSGLISVGIGDTSAAIIGTLLGRKAIMKSSGKTLEGFLGNFLSMVLFKFAWIGFGAISSELSFLIVAFLTASVEVLTENCDNLVLPLAMMLFVEIF